MRYRFEQTIGWPADAVVSVIRDRVGRLYAYLAAVDSVAELERSGAGDRLTVRRRWQLEPSVLPPGFRGLVPDADVGFEDRLVFEGPRVARFSVHPLVHADAIVCDGRLELFDEGGETSLEVEAQLTITPAGVARLPGAMQSRGAPALEGVLVSAVRGQLHVACEAIETLLDDEWG